MASNIAGFFASLPSKIDRSKTAGLNGAYHFVITGDGGGEWTVVFEDGEPRVSEGETVPPDVTFTTTSQTWDDLLHGRVSGGGAFMSGDLKVQGDMTMAMQLQSIVG
jgi:putative sterol carrier protein